MTVVDRAPEGSGADVPPRLNAPELSAPARRTVPEIPVAEFQPRKQQPRFGQPRFNQPKFNQPGANQPGIGQAGVGRSGLLSIFALVMLLLIPAVLAIVLKMRDSDPSSVAAVGTEAAANGDASGGAVAPGGSVANGSVAPGGSAATGAAAANVDCTIEQALRSGDSGAAVQCLEAKLSAQGYLNGPVDQQFDAATASAVEAFQQDHQLVVDGVVGPETGKQLGAWAGPDKLPPDPSTCPASGNAAVVDRFNQRSWLCQDGAITKVMPMTSAATQPDPGSYKVYAKDMNSSSNLTGRYSTMTHFVAFTKGKYSGARVAFHSVPKYSDGEFVQPLDSVGTPERYGDSSGCIRVLPDDAQLIWDWLDVGDAVIVVS